MKPYRPCVVAVVCHSDGKLLIGKRQGLDAWQLPQGGMDPGEDPEQAVRRELQEEVGSGEVEILKQLEEPILYDFPEGSDFPLAKKFRGQSQYWFLLRYRPGFGPCLESASDNEFDALDWAPAEDVLSGVIYWKQEAYQQGLERLKLLT